MSPSASPAVIDELRIPYALLRLPQARAALAYADRAHAGQRRSVDGAAFILHPLEVASLLLGARAPEHVIAAGALHDTLEKTEADADDLRRRFGSRITALVLAVSEDKSIDDGPRRKAALRDQTARAGREALLILAADKISKVRELRLGGTAPRHPDGFPRREPPLAHYRSCLALLEDRLIDSGLVRTLGRELNAAG